MRSMRQGRHIAAVMAALAAALALMAVGARTGDSLRSAGSGTNGWGHCCGN